MEPSRPKPRGSSFAAPRRVFTAPVPAALETNPAQPASAVTGIVDTLYDHPNVKIVSFSAGSHHLTVGPRAHEVEPGTLSWFSQLERTIAVGPFRIYRAPGSVAFLSCGSALQPILPKSQAWCVDEESSKFILQIRRPQYWRIEVPVDEAEDQQRAQVLREVFDKILQFEKTECPFKRSFTVELPERPDTPTSRKPWTPVRRSSACLPLRPTTSVEIAHVHRGPPRGSICIGDLRLPEDTNSIPSQRTGNTESFVEEEAKPSALDASPRAEPTGLALRPKPIKTGQTKEKGPVTPPQLNVLTPPSSNTKTQQSSEGERHESQRPAESLDSFQNPESWRPTPLPPSPPLSNPGSPFDSPRLSEPAVLNIPVTQQGTFSAINYSAGFVPSLASKLESSTVPDIPSRTLGEVKPEPFPALPVFEVSDVAVEDEPEPLAMSASNISTSIDVVRTPSTPNRRPGIRRATTSSSISPGRRALSPPSAADLFGRVSATTPPKRSNNRMALVHRLPMTVFQKTCEILMSPPSHLIALMLKVAARIVAGEWRGLMVGMSEEGERIPVQWDWTDEQDHFQPQARRATGLSRGRDADEWWLKRKKSNSMMAGTFPESDDEDLDPLDSSRKSQEGTRKEQAEAEWGVD
ncbi:inheritance of peroxisomes protein 1-domain-containing protein [Podospora australis]|uniref:Inheritance of peroxisomes protein 1 n=1 Tax=Podospora australis TaxID=1536484 RepID=A0AAN6WUP0_9PEZI|nr:inheritance of peroxisomes protein 1-domain-containing protein [Podospora australis]